MDPRAAEKGRDIMIGRDMLAHPDFARTSGFGSVPFPGCVGELRYLDPDELLGRGLHAFLASVQETCNRVGLEIQQAYFLG